MYEHTEQVILGGVTYPIRCDINVLIEIQEQFESLERFELLLSGLEIVRNPDGRAVLDKEGRVRFRKGQPSYRAVAAILPYMLKEGEAVSGGKCDTAPALEAVEAAAFDLEGVVAAMHREYSKCFERKNPQSAKEEGKGTPTG